MRKGCTVHGHCYFFSPYVSSSLAFTGRPFPFPSTLVMARRIFSGDIEASSKREQQTSGVAQAEGWGEAVRVKNTGSSRLVRLCALRRSSYKYIVLVLFLVPDIQAGGRRDQ